MLTDQLIFLTGGTRFLGRHLVAGLLERGYCLMLLLRPTSDISWLKSAKFARWPVGDWGGRVYNICDQPYSHAYVNHLVSELLGINSWCLNVPRWLMITIASLMERWAQINRREPFYPLNLRFYVFSDWLVSNEKARLDLGFEPTPYEKG